MANNNYFFGTDQAGVLGDAPRYFYGLRRNTNGNLYLGRMDQLNRSDELVINESGPIEENYENFQVGVDFHEGRNVNHEIVYDNLKYEQYRWDGRALYYYINDDGELVCRVRAIYEYPSGIGD
jgi:hypothetical protein